MLLPKLIFSSHLLTSRFLLFYCKPCELTSVVQIWTDGSTLIIIVINQHLYLTNPNTYMYVYSKWLNGCLPFCLNGIGLCGVSLCAHPSPTSANYAKARETCRNRFCSRALLPLSLALQTYSILTWNRVTLASPHWDVRQAVLPVVQTLPVLYPKPILKLRI